MSLLPHLTLPSAPSLLPGSATHTITPVLNHQCAHLALLYCLFFPLTSQVPALLPGAASHTIKVVRYYPGRNSWARRSADPEWKQLQLAKHAGLAVAVRCRLQRGVRGEWVRGNRRKWVWASWEKEERYCRVIVFFLHCDVN